jgi:hypothetical protein
MKLIFDADQWDTYLSHRNLSVHDYIGLESEETPLIVKSFLKDLGDIVFK